MTRRILVCGDRNWADPRPIRALLSQYPRGTVVIHGAQRGADSIAGRLAHALGFEVEAYPADWRRYGKSAGPIRNKQMLTDGMPDEVHAFHSNIDWSRGTKDMVLRAREAHIPVTIHE